MNRIRTLTLLAAIAVLLPMTPSRTHAQAAGETIVVHAHRFAFVPAEITVKQGEPVTLELISDDVTHLLLVPDLGISQEIAKGHPARVTFTAQKAGDFSGQCGRFCGSGHGSMVFTVHVKPD
ncbi:MAG TPA: cupredoxin domain-containing protein [Acidobacteriaceae bacterium]|nr:cupredoxin domain-containing protein [Acidobacteriaceae bacterium]